MSKTIKIPIVGRRPPPYLRERIEERRIKERALRTERHRKPEKPDDFILYENSDSEEETAFEQHSLLTTSYNFVDCIQSREMNVKEIRDLDRTYASKYVLTHDMLKEHPLSLGNVNKIFCSQWLNNRQIIYGTKCNRIMIYNVNTKKVDNIPTIPNSEPSINDGQPAIINGIHSIRINPSRTLLATGGRHSADIAIYKLPTLDPLNIGENGHRDWIMDLCWLDDEFLVSGSKDAKISFWRVNETFNENPNVHGNGNDEDDGEDDADADVDADDDDEARVNDDDGDDDGDDEEGNSSNGNNLRTSNGKELNSLKLLSKKKRKKKKSGTNKTMSDKKKETAVGVASSRINGNADQTYPKHAKIVPLVTRECKTAQKIRSMCFNDEYKEIIVLSLNGYIHLFNAETFTQTLSRKLPNCQDNVCIAHQPGGLYAIGCRSYTLLLDPRTLQSVKKIASRYSGCGIRSASFQDNLLTVGTGLGMVMFYDVRAGKYLENSINSARTVALKASKGYVFPEEDMEGFQQIKYVPAIYTHCYDSSGTRLFAAGGPLPANLVGNYAGIWQ